MAKKIPDCRKPIVYDEMCFAIEAEKGILMSDSKAFAKTLSSSEFRSWMAYGFETYLNEWMRRHHPELIQRLHRRFKSTLL